MTIDADRRNEILAKYRSTFDAPPDPNNPQLLAMLDGSRVVAAAFNWDDDVDLKELFDPSRCSEMYEVARRLHRDLRTAMANDAVTYADADGNPFDPEDVDEGAVLVHFVGSPDLCVVRPDAVDMFATVYQAARQVAIRTAPPARCQVRTAEICDKACANGRSLEFWPYLAGRILLMIPICGSCRNKACETAETNYTFAEIAARERSADLPAPAWAREAPAWRRWWAKVRRVARRPR